MALIGMAVFDTAENKRSWMTRKTLESLRDTVDWKKHRLIVVDNASCPETLGLYEEASKWFEFGLIANDQNIGTALAVNKAWAHRFKGEHTVKMDNDVVIHEKGWLDTLEECVSREPTIGIIGLKRRDLGESPHEPEGDFLHSELVMLPHKLGERWLVVEVCRQVIGTCQLYSSALLDKIGYLTQPGSYGWDDCLSAVRCERAGFVSCFYPHINIDHVDPGGDKFCEWKIEHASEMHDKFQEMRDDFASGKRSIYCDVGGK